MGIQNGDKQISILNTCIILVYIISKHLITCLELIVLIVDYTMYFWGFWKLKRLICNAGSFIDILIDQYIAYRQQSLVCYQMFFHTECNPYVKCFMVDIWYFWNKTSYFSIFGIITQPFFDIEFSSIYQ